MYVVTSTNTIIFMEFYHAAKESIKRKGLARDEYQRDKKIIELIHKSIIFSNIIFLSKYKGK